MRWYIHVTSVHHLPPPELVSPTPPGKVTVCGFASDESSQTAANFAAAEARLLGGTLASLAPVLPSNSLATGDLLVVRAPSVSPAAGRYARGRLVDVDEESPNDPQLRVQLLDYTCHVTGQPLECVVSLSDSRRFIVPDRGAESDAEDIEKFANSPPMGRTFCLAEPADADDEENAENGKISLAGFLAVAALVDSSPTELPLIRLRRLAPSELPSPRHRHSAGTHWTGSHWSNEPLHLAESDALEQLELAQLREYIIHCNCLAGRELALRLFEEKVRNDCTSGSGATAAGASE